MTGLSGMRGTLGWKTNKRSFSSFLVGIVSFGFRFVCLGLFYNGLVAPVIAQDLGTDSYLRQSMQEEMSVQAANMTAGNIAPQRIVALAPHAVELLFALGLGERIVATTEFADYPEAAKSIPRIGGYNGMNIESIYALEPDLVIAWEGGNQEKDIKRLEELGLSVLRTRVKTLDTLGGHIRELGALLDASERAEEVAGQYERSLARIRAENLAKPEVSFFYQLWLRPLKTMTAKSWVNEALKSCRGRNIFPDDPLTEYPGVSIEQILVAQPQVIIVPSHHGDDAETKDLWTDWPEIPAVRDGHIFYLNGDHLHRYSLRILEGVEAVCKSFDTVRMHLKSQDHARN